MRPRGWVADLSTERDDGAWIGLRSYRRASQMLPSGGADIHIFEIAPYIDEYADLIERTRRASDRTSSRDPVRVSGTEDSQRVVFAATRRAGRLFIASLAYYAGDGKAVAYERILDEVVASLRATEFHSADLPSVAGVIVAVGLASGMPGESVSFPVSTRSERSDIRILCGAINVSNAVHVETDAQGQPLCRRSREVCDGSSEYPAPKRLPVSFYHGGGECVLPSTDAACEMGAVLRFCVETMDNAVRPNVALFTCTATIGQASAPGPHTVHVFDARAEGLHGDDLGALGSDGTIVVLGGSEPEPR